jgi:tRNA threonylcarbamoyladenosine biosynthesis protein TsaE
MIDNGDEAMRLIFVSTSPAETRMLASTLGKHAEPGLLIGLQGRLGAGKTVFVRGLAEGLGIADPRVVASPTFMLIHEYDARLPIYHFDSYRLVDENAFVELGINEYFEGEGVSIVEWSDRVESTLPRERINIRITDDNGTDRRIESALQGDRWKGVFLNWTASMDELLKSRGLTDRLRLVEE